MSPLEHVLAAAKLVVESGRVPSLALIKTKLTTSIPMPILIQGLQHYRGMSPEAIESIVTHMPAQQQMAEPATELETLKAEMVELKTAFQQLSERLAKLEASQTGSTT